MKHALRPIKQTRCWQSVAVGCALAAAVFCEGLASVAWSVWFEQRGM